MIDNIIPVRSSILKMLKRFYQKALDLFKKNNDYSKIDMYINTTNKEGCKMGENSVVPVNEKGTPEAGRDPLSKMVEIAKDKELSPEDRKELISYAQKRFANRRRMAYISLFTIVGSLVLLFAAGFIDGLSTRPGGTGILDALKNNQTLIAWIEGFLTSIVAAYYGISAWRPAS